MAKFLKRHETKIVTVIGVVLLLSLVTSAVARIQSGSQFYTSERGLTQWVGIDLAFGGAFLVAIAAGVILARARRRNRT